MALQKGLTQKNPLVCLMFENDTPKNIANSSLSKIFLESIESNITIISTSQIRRLISTTPSPRAMKSAKKLFMNSYIKSS